MLVVAVFAYLRRLRKTTDADTVPGLLELLVAAFVVYVVGVVVAVVELD